MIDPVALGCRLKALREQRGLNQQIVAESLAIPRTALTKIETATRSISIFELTRFAEIFGVTPAALLSEGGGTTDDLQDALAIALPELATRPEFAAMVRRVIGLCEEGTDLRSLLAQREPRIPSYEMSVASTAEGIRQAETVAEEERRRLGLGHAPVSHLARLFSAEGIWITSSTLPDDVSGLFVNHAGTGLAIMVNNDLREVRRRFAFAHEYAHVLFDRAETVLVTRRSNATALIETRANAFAAAFLMPGDGVLEQLRQLDKGHPSRLSLAIFDVANDSMYDAEIRPAAGSQTITFQDVAFIARHFMVSYEAAAWRLRSLNRLSQAEANSLIAQKQVGRDYLKLLDFADLVDDAVRDQVRPDWEREQELRGQLVRLAMEAFRRDAISSERLRGIALKLCLPAKKLMAIAKTVKPP